MKAHEKKTKKAKTHVKKTKKAMIMGKHTKMSAAEIKRAQQAQQKALRKLTKWIEGILLVMSPKDAFEAVVLIKNSGLFNLFVALGRSAKLLKHLKKGKK